MKVDFDKKEELYKKGKKALEMYNFDEAGEYFLQILEEEPNETTVLNKMGVVFVHRDDRERAREYFERCLELDPNFVASLSNMASLELEDGKMNEAEVLFRNALRFDPNYGPAHNNLAYILKKTGRVSEAVKHMKKAQKAGTASFSYNPQKVKKFSKGTLTLIILAIIALILWFLTRA
ncbi:MAG: tetratricopeptide repeat protein [Halanaerobiales bacterium]|nr:tetratricopeptide repeat protein [Halanaerobiales bacterium]